jgi:hypothetical protein
MYEDPSPPSQELENLEALKHSTLFRNATVPSNGTSRYDFDNIPPLRPFASNLESSERKRSREDSSDCSTDSAESNATTRPVTIQSSFLHEAKRRTVDIEKTADMVTVSNGSFVTAQSIISEAAVSIDNTSNETIDATAQITTDSSFKQPIPPLKTDEPDWTAHPDAWGYLQSLNEEYPSKYLERTTEPDGNDRAGYMLGRSDRCELM